MAIIERWWPKKIIRVIIKNEAKGTRMEGKIETITKIDWQGWKIKQKARIHHPINVVRCWKTKSVHKATGWYIEKVV